MPHLLFKLNGVPEDEAIEVRRLLDEHRIDYYETDAGMFGISLAALWLRDEGEIERAQSLLEAYQQQRWQQAREAYEQALQEGNAETQMQRLWHQPLRSLVYLGVIVLILYLSLYPFIAGLR